ncbi:MAG: M48 family metallopeptidase [Actinomycetota bacterium]|nr:M48 family metallopeptidase [Actinomycetota bacterium]
MYEEITSNKRRSWLLIFVFVSLVGAIGWIFGQLTQFGYGGLVVAVAVAIVMAVGSYYNSDKVVLAMSHAHPADPKQYQFLHNTVEGLAIAAGIPKPKIYVIDDAAPNAFATGRDPDHSVIAVTTGLLAKMDRLELEGVVAHEMSHIRNYDIKFMTLTVVLVGVVILLSHWLLRSFWWGGRDREEGGGGGFIILMVVGLVLAILAPILAQLIKLAVSRKREYLADANGALLTRYPAGLAGALRKIAADPAPLAGANEATAPLYISPPKQRGLTGKVKELWSTHPPTEERIKRLEAMGNIA